MERTFFFLYVLLGCSTLHAQECGDGTIYASEKQTGADPLFARYPKLYGFESMPRFKDGNENLHALIYAKLKLSAEARAVIFNLNFQFTVTCDGRVTNVKQLGAPRMDNWTNIAEILLATSDWKAATKDGKAVDCLYFGRILINGTYY